MSGLLTVGLADYFASWASPLLGLYAASLTAIRRASAPGVGGATAFFYDLHCAYHGEEVKSPPREVEGEAEKADASVSAQVFGDGFY